VPRLAVSETDTIEGKESFNWGSKHDYFKILAGMANNKGGYILFGVKDGSFEIVGIADDRMDRFDLKKANEFITRTFNQALVLDKGQFTIGGKTIGVLHVSVSANKLVICTLDANALCSGDIFYRYPGETRRIQAPELEALLNQRDSSAESRLLHLVAKLAESGAHNAAVINLASGEVTGERGQFLIEESLFDKIKFITEGRLEEKDGAPTLRVLGDVKSIGAPRVTIQQSVLGSVSERHIQDAFLKQSCDYDPRVYIQAQTHLQPLWLPIYYFASEVKLDLAGLKKVLESSETPYGNRIIRQIERVTSGNAPAGIPGVASVRAELDAMRALEAIDVADEHAAKRYMQAMRLVTPDEVSLAHALSVLCELRARFGNNRELLYDFRYAIAAVDLRWFRSKLS
jgi:Putative DNA-binding domain